MNNIQLIIPNRRRVIKDNEFSGKEELLSVEMPDSISTIGESSFGFCVNLE